MYDIIAIPQAISTMSFAVCHEHRDQCIHIFIKSLKIMNDRKSCNVNKTVRLTHITLNIWLQSLNRWRYVNHEMIMEW